MEDSGNSCTAFRFLDGSEMTSGLIPECVESALRFINSFDYENIFQIFSFRVVTKDSLYVFVVNIPPLNWTEAANLSNSSGVHPSSVSD